jgi:hypothetical protein
VSVIVLTTLTAIATSLRATAAVIRAFRAVMKQTHLAIREGKALWLLAGPLLKKTCEDFTASVCERVCK